MTIKTADCVKALAAAWPAQYTGDASNWKRLTRTGSKKTSFVRTFEHYDLPLTATVIEKDGAITSTEIKIVGPWDIDDTSDHLLDKCDKPECIAFLAKHLKATDFIFFASETDGETWCVINPVTVWRREQRQWDMQLDYFLVNLLPESVSEVQSATFCSDLTPDELRAELLKCGFVQDPDFDKFMSR